MSVSKMVRCTVWQCREWEGTLVLRGSTKETRALAASYRGHKSRAPLYGEHAMLLEKDIKKLPEFGG